MNPPNDTRRRKARLASKGIASCCHSGEAEKVGREMRPTQLLMFGHARGGPPLMRAAPTVAIDLALKALFREDEARKVWVTSTSPHYLQQRHTLPPEPLRNIAVLDDLLPSVTSPDLCVRSVTLL